MSASCVKLLIDARALIEKGWCQRAYAKDKYGESVHPEDPSAVSFCMKGAIMHFQSSQTANAYQYLRASVSGVDPMSYNEASDCTVAEILEIYDKAIAIAKEHSHVR